MYTFGHFLRSAPTNRGLERGHPVGEGRPNPPAGPRGGRPELKAAEAAAIEIARQRLSPIGLDRRRINGCQGLFSGNFGRLAAAKRGRRGSAGGRSRSDLAASIGAGRRAAGWPGPFPGRLQATFQARKLGSGRNTIQTGLYTCVHYCTLLDTPGHTGTPFPVRRTRVSVGLPRCTGRQGTNGSPGAAGPAAGRPRARPGTAGGGAARGRGAGCHRGEGGHAVGRGDRER